MQEVLQCLKKHGQRLDLELAAEMRVPLATVRKLLAELAAAGEVVMCQLTRYEGSKTIEAWQCRVRDTCRRRPQGGSRRRPLAASGRASRTIAGAADGRQAQPLIMALPLRSALEPQPLVETSSIDTVRLRARSSILTPGHTYS